MQGVEFLQKKNDLSVTGLTTNHQILQDSQQKQAHSECSIRILVQTLVLLTDEQEKLRLCCSALIPVISLAVAANTYHRNDANAT